MKTLNLIKNNYNKTKLSILGVLLTLIFLLSSVFLQPGIDVYAESSDQRVFDNAGLLTSDEIASLETAALEIGEKYNTDIYILTDEDSDGKSRKDYMEDFADAKEVFNSTLIFVNMESGNRGFEIQGYGDDEYLINESRIYAMIDNIKPYLSDGDYHQAFATFLEEVDYYLGVSPSEDTSNYSPDYDEYARSDKNYEDENAVNSILSELWVQIIISLIIGGVVVGIMAINSGGRVTVNERTYLDANHSRVIAQRDDYIRTATTKTRRPQNNNHSGGGGGGGISSGGRSHSGGGSSF